MLNDELERIYREANDIPAGKRAPLTTEAVFKAMRAAITTEREACAKVCEAIGPELIRWWGDGQANAAAQECATVIRMRSNV